MASHGVTLVFPSTAYNSQANLEAIQNEKYETLAIKIEAFQMYKFSILTDTHVILSHSRCNFVYGTPTMFTDLVNQDLSKYDLSAVEAGETFGDQNMIDRMNLAK